MWDWDNPPIEIQRLEIPNHHFMRGQPTNCYLLGDDSIVVVDPGDTQGVEIVLEALRKRDHHTVQAIYLTHAHPDHAPAAIELRRELDAPVMLHPENDPIMRDHISWDDVDIVIDTDMPFIVEDRRFDQLLTPGHAPGHVALFNESSGVMIAGDLVSGNGTIGVFPPHGSMAAYIRSLKFARAHNPRFLLPGHGPVIDDAPTLFQHYLERRAQREGEILRLLGKGRRTIEEFRSALYPELDPQLSYAADSTIRAHLIKLGEEGLAMPDSDDVMTANWDPS